MIMSTRTGLIVTVYKPADGMDCTNGGETARFQKFVATGKGIEGPFEPSAEMPEMKILPRLGGLGGYRAVPASIPEGKWTMFGGNFIYTSDSRFPSRYPIPVHDRVEFA